MRCRGAVAKEIWMQWKTMMLLLMMAGAGAGQAADLQFTSSADFKRLQILLEDQDGANPGPCRIISHPDGRSGEARSTSEPCSDGAAIDRIDQWPAGHHGNGAFRFEGEVPDIYRTSRGQKTFADPDQLSLINRREMSGLSASLRHFWRRPTPHPPQERACSHGNTVRIYPSLPAKRSG